MKIFSMIIGLIFSHITYAGSGEGEVLEILVISGGGNGSGVVMFKTEMNSNKAICSVADGGAQWAFSLENEYGMAMYSLLLAAQAQQKPIGVVGAGDCSSWADRERPDYIYLNN